MQSSPMNCPDGGACGDEALSAGCASIMPIDRLPAALGDAPLADATVVVRDVLQQPLDGVVGVGALVGRPSARF